MHDIKWIRENPDAFDAGLKKRRLAPQSAPLIALDKARREAQTRAQEIQQERNALSKQIGVAKSKGEDAAELLEKVSASKAAEEAAESEAGARTAELDAALAGIPNIPGEGVPEGADEAANVEVAVWGNKPDLGFEPKEHFEIGEALGAMDFERAAKLSGSRFVILTGPLARLERALAQFMLDLQTSEFGYNEVSPPVLVRETALFGTGQLPKFGEDLFRTTQEHWLIPTAEVPLTNLVAGEILDEDALPLRFTAHTGCFRAEAGAAGKDTRGMLRQHQFYKVELVSIAHPEHSEEEHERMTGAAETVLQRLGLHYRKVLLCTGDMGFSARKTYDLEVWLPGQDAYREISSCSNCGDFQARRMNARFRPKEGKGTRFVHTLNGSGLAVGRALIAVLENFQQEDGTVTVPEALRPYMGGLETIGPADA
ncbi:MAG TPA: serine--tRNA ligase [Alphaproteobacteria bacterium]|nr:serine--tRNA ligase [Alphaproteobacteria bacterium]